MPTRTARSTPSSRATRITGTRRASPSRRGPSARRAATRRRGIAGGWLQRRQPQPKGIKKVLLTARRSKGRSAFAAVGLALAGAAGVAFRKRDRGDELPHEKTTPAGDTSPPVNGPPTPSVTTPPNTSAHGTEPPSAA